MSNTPSPATSAAERRRQRILNSGGDRLSKITGAQKVDEAVTSAPSVVDAAKPREPDTQPSLFPSPVTAGASSHVVQNPTRAAQTSALSAPSSGAPSMQVPQLPAEFEGLRQRFEEVMKAAADSNQAPQSVLGQGIPPAQASAAKTIIVPPSPVASFVRFAVAGVMVALCIHFLSQFSLLEDLANTSYNNEENEYVSTAKPVFLGPFNLSPIASLAVQQIHLNVGIPLIGGLSISVWGIFVLIELGRQVFRFTSSANEAEIVALPGGAMTQMALTMASSKLGGDSSSVQQSLKVFGQFRAMYQSLVEDLSVFVVFLGVAVGFSNFYVNYFASANDASAN
ncbi:hypothetical protein HDU81_002534 [Chytriomyces hyalinus]|nr:hypothetical protein HDU81_002531 [Chytriomyces hyalinus]KAJ3233074.1 hypothetical protein HDU81_002534 [Chytriomyces hyalinus]